MLIALKIDDGECIAILNCDYLASNLCGGACRAYKKRK
jgi:hypothetical protein